MTSLRSAVTCLLIFVGIFATSEAFVGGLKARAKENLLETVESGASNDEVLKAVREVEKFSMLGGADLKNPRLAGNWLMVWTTSNSIAGKTKPKLLQTETPPEQMIDVENGKALNAQYVLGVRNSVQADITPMTNNKVKVLFKVFSVGPISFKADGERFKGELSVTYLDDDMRISRGDQGNAFVLLRESRQRENADRIWKNWKKSWKD